MMTQNLDSTVQLIEEYGELTKKQEQLVKDMQEICVRYDEKKAQKQEIDEKIGKIRAYFAQKKIKIS